MTAASGGAPGVVALGGGHGLAASLSALRRVTDRLTAIVTVADDGGSSGRIREEFGGLPPGDLRMALAALVNDDDWSRSWAELFQHRFPGSGQLGGHTVGNVVLAALMQTTGSPVAALDHCARLLGAAGRVLPMATQELEIVADVAGLDPADPTAITEVRGQVAVATTRGRVLDVRLVPEEPTNCPETLAAVHAADWVVLGPGSLYTSVLPHLLAPALRKAVLGTAARRLFVLNLAPQPGETDGFAPETHLEVLAAHAADLSLDVVLADADTVLDTRGLIDAAAALGARVHLASVAAGNGRPEHDPARLAAAFREVFGDAPEAGTSGGTRKG